LANFPIFQKPRSDDVINRVKEKLETALEDWELMKKASEDESEECAERFERHFYEFIDELKFWYQHLEQPPSTIEEAEDLIEISEIIKLLPAPLELNFLTELELIIEGEDRVRYD
jgi:hypothetical protein